MTEKISLHAAAGPRVARIPARTGTRDCTETEERDFAGDAAELRRILGTIPMSDPSYGLWWGSADGRWLYEKIRFRIGSPIAGTVNRKYGLSYEPTDVANTAVTMLRQDFTHAYILRAHDPWSYLSQILKREMFAAVGAYFRVEWEGVSPRVISHQDQQPAVSLQEAAALTYRHLEPLVGEPLRKALKEAIAYFSELGGARISHLYTHATTDLELTGLGLSREEILAIANAVLGSRPRNAETSLIAAFLGDPDFDPMSSLAHRKALRKFARRIAGASRPGVLVA